MDDLTKKVRDMYMLYPFPGEDYTMAYGIQILRHFAQLARPGEKSRLEKASILDAGCGTGSLSVGLAKQFPAARITAIDMTDASLEMARAKAAAAGVGNVDFRPANLLELDLGEQFDVIFCVGVLHHLSDPLTGLQALVRHLKPDGLMVLWLYGTYGRFRLNLNQRMLQILFRDTESLADRVEMTKTPLRDGPQDALRCHFNVARSEIENDWDAARDWLLEKDSWIIDQFLHLNERTVNIEDVYQLFDASGLMLRKWVGLPTNPAELLPEPEVRAKFEKLGERDKSIVLDLLLKPNYYTIIAGKNQEQTHDR